MNHFENSESQILLIFGEIPAIFSFGSRTEISDFEHILFIDQNVVDFKIIMSNSLLMQIMKSFQ